MLNWWHRLSRLSKIGGMVGMVAGALVSTAAAWAVIEPYWYASRGYTRAYVPTQIDEKTGPMTKALYGLQISNNERDCEKVADEIIVMSVLLPKEPDATTRERKAFQLSQKKQRYDDLDSKLKGWRAGRGCPYSHGN